MTTETSSANSLTPRSVSPVSDKGDHVEVPKSLWGQKIMATNEEEARARPWKKIFGEPTGVKDPNGEDWIDYPAIYDVSKKGISG
jgi:hypothetical protein